MDIRRFLKSGNPIDVLVFCFLGLMVVCGAALLVTNNITHGFRVVGAVLNLIWQLIIGG